MASQRCLLSSTQSNDVRKNANYMSSLLYSCTGMKFWWAYPKGEDSAASPHQNQLGGGRHFLGFAFGREQSQAR